MFEARPFSLNMITRLKRDPNIFPGEWVSGRKALLGKLFNLLEHQSHRVEKMQKKASSEDIKGEAAQTAGNTESRGDFVPLPPWLMVQCLQEAALHGWLLFMIAN